MVGSTPAEVLERVGWARSVAGVNPYTTLFSRAKVSRVDADLASKRADIHELPAARGCTYVVPSSDFVIALRLSQGTGDSGDIKTAKKFLGVTEEELEKLGARVLEVVGSAPLDPAAIKDLVGDAARSLGEEGKAWVKKAKSAAVRRRCLWCLAAYSQRV